MSIDEKENRWILNENEKEVVFLDIRIEKTERAIKQAFLSLREQKPLEKIKIKELCEKACINKSTFYAHYQDIYALENALEEELIASILGSLPEFRTYDLRSCTEWLIQELFRAFVANQKEVEILFSGSRQGGFINRIEQEIRRRIEEYDSDFANDPVRGVILSFCVQGSYYTFSNNSKKMDEKKLVDLLAAIARAAQNIELK